MRVPGRSGFLLTWRDRLFKVGHAEIYWCIVILLGAYRLGRLDALYSGLVLGE